MYASTMPRRKYGKKRRYRRRRKRMPLTPLTGRLGFPANTVTKMRYMAKFALNPGTGGLVTTHNFAANGLYDVDITGTGHQPRGFDQWATFYNHYHVLGSKCSVTVWPDTTSANGIPVAWGIHLNDDTAVPTGAQPNDLIEQGYAPYRMTSASTYATGLQSRPLIKKFSAKKFFNRTNVKDEDQIGSPVNNNPADLAYFTVWMGAVDYAELDDPPSFNCTAVIDFIVTFSEPLELAQST